MQYTTECINIAYFYPGKDNNSNSNDLYNSIGSISNIILKICNIAST